MKKIVLASGNTGKIIQIKEFLKPLNIDIKSMKEFNIQEPVENGKSYAENALIKAENAFSVCGLPSLADDSGFELNALNGFPGLVCGRFAEACGGYEHSFEILNKCLTDDKKALFYTSIALVYEKNGKIIKKIFNGEIKGKFIFPPKGENGFGYCPCFIPDGYDITMAQMQDNEREKINHRAIALNKLYSFLESENIFQ